MDRRTFLKTTAIVTTTPLITSCENKPRVESKWIAFKDQMPEAQDKIDVKNGEKEIHCGRMITLTDSSLIGLEDKTPYFYYKLADGKDGTRRMALASVDPNWHWRYVS